MTRSEDDSSAVVLSFRDRCQTKLGFGFSWLKNSRWVWQLMMYDYETIAVVLLTLNPFCCVVLSLSIQYDSALRLFTVSSTAVSKKRPACKIIVLTLATLWLAELKWSATVESIWFNVWYMLMHACSECTTYFAYISCWANITADQVYYLLSPAITVSNFIRVVCMWNRGMRLPRPPTPIVDVTKSAILNGSWNLALHFLHLRLSNKTAVAASKSHALLHILWKRRIWDLSIPE